MAGADDVIAQQVALYGRPLGMRFATLTSAFGIPQSRLAQIIGLSAPMLSQLASGQRVKISNPSVYARLLRLEELADSPAARTGDPTQLRAALDEIAASHPQLSTGHLPAGRDAAVDHLARIADPEDLSAAARSVRSQALAAVLRDSAERARHAGSRV